MMCYKIFYYLLILLFCQNSYGQDFATDSISKTKISQLAFLVGNWQGEGWIMGRDRKKMNFNQTEKIQFKLDSTAVLVEGQGLQDEKIVHNAMAIISYNDPDDSYIFQSYLQNGKKGEFTGNLIENKFYWYPNDQTRYIIWINEKAQWRETGEYNQGDKWFQFFEMTLNAVE